MPIRKVKGGYKWGGHGHVYPNRKGAEKQAAAAHANGFHEDTTMSRKDRIKARLTEAKKNAPVHVLHVHHDDAPTDPEELAKYHGATHSENLGGGMGQSEWHHTFPHMMNAHDLARDVGSHGSVFHNTHPQAAKGKFHPKHLKEIK